MRVSFVARFSLSILRAELFLRPSATPPQDFNFDVDCETARNSPFSS